MTNKVISFFVISAHLTPESDEIYALPNKEGAKVPWSVQS